MKVVVTGANGFIGRALVQRLCADRNSLKPLGSIRELVLCDLDLSNAPVSDWVRKLQGSIGDTAVLEALLPPGHDADVIFHLASVPGGAAERDYERGRQVNLNATLALLERAARPARPPVVVFASSIAVYGAELPQVIDQHTLPRPTMSYGTHKLVAELVVADLSRRGWLDGRSLRIPGVVARPRGPSGLLSAFMSDMIHDLCDGKHFVCPVSSQATAWWMSVACAVDNLLLAARLPSAQLSGMFTYNLPVLRFPMHDLVETIAAMHGTQVFDQISFEPDEHIERAFGRLPVLDASSALKVGFSHDGTIENLIRRSLESCPTWP